MGYEGEAMILYKNEHYWEFDSVEQRLPYLDVIKNSYFTNKATEFLHFRQGALRFLNDIDPSFKDEILTRNGELREKWKGKLWWYCELLWVNSAPHFCGWKNLTKKDIN